MSETATVLFMSQEHVDAMNALLVDSDVVKDACKVLDRPRTLTYELSDGPGGELVHWTTRLDDTVQFSLARPSDPDVVFVGDWARMIRASQAARNGETFDPGLEVVGDLQVVVQIGAILDVARGVAQLPVEFPDVATVRP